MVAITFSGVNGIEFSAILDAVVECESLPLKAMQADRQKVQNKDSAILKAGNFSINVTTDYSPIKDSLKAIVTEFNKLRQFYTQQTKGDLGADPVLRGVLNELKTVMLTANSNGGRYQYLAEIGLELTSSGELKLDESKLAAALSAYPGDVEQLFHGPRGVFDTLLTTLNNLIVQHLQSTLDLDRGGDVAAGLNRLYSYITSRILDGSTRLETAPLEEALKLLEVLLVRLGRHRQDGACPLWSSSDACAEGCRPRIRITRMKRSNWR